VKEEDADSFLLPRFGMQAKGGAKGNTMTGPTIIQAVSHDFKYYLATGRHVFALYTCILNQILENTLPVEVFSPFLFDNCSLRHSQVLANVEVPVNYSEIQKYEVEKELPAHIDQQSIPINREFSELLKYSVFSQLGRNRAKCYRLTLQGAFFGDKLKVLLQTHCRNSSTFSLTPSVR